MRESQTIKVWKSTLKKLRMLRALLDKSMVLIIDELATQELERLEQEKATHEQFHKEAEYLLSFTSSPD